MYGLVLNLLCTLAALAMVVLDWPMALAVAVHLVPVPYSVIAATGVWRSADAYSGARKEFPRIARTMVVVWFCFWFFF